MIMTLRGGRTYCTIEGRFLLSDVEACYEVYHLMSNNLVDNSDHRQDLEDYILEVYEYDEDFMRFLTIM